MCASTSVVSTPGNRCCTLAIATSSTSVILKIHAHLKFSVSGRSKQASKQASIHKHVCNEVMVVWGSLRLAPIILSTDFESPLFPPLLFPTPISLPLAPQPRTQVQEDLGLKLRDTYTTDYRQHLSSYLSIPCLYNWDIISVYLACITGPSSQYTLLV